MGTFSNSFYQDLYDVAPGTLRRDTSGLSAVCLLPPKVKLERPYSAMASPAIRKDTPAGPPYGRRGPLTRRPQTAHVGNASAAKAEANETSARPSEQGRSARPRPHTAKEKGEGKQGENKSRPTTADSFSEKVSYYRQQPVSKSRKCWNRINPGHMLEKWDSTHRATTNPNFPKTQYKMEKEFHLPKTDIMIYVNDMIKMRVSIKTGFR